MKAEMEGHRNLSPGRLLYSAPVNFCIVQINFHQRAPSHRHRHRHNCQYVYTKLLFSSVCCMILVNLHQSIMRFRFKAVCVLFLMGYHFWFMPTFSRKQLGRITRTTYAYIYILSHTHTHPALYLYIIPSLCYLYSYICTHCTVVYIYIYIYVCVCVCVCVLFLTVKTRNMVLVSLLHVEYTGYWLCICVSAQIHLHNCCLKVTFKTRNIIYEVILFKTNMLLRKRTCPSPYDILTALSDPWTSL
jgi:hypothetical protein